MAQFIPTVKSSLNSSSVSQSGGLASAHIAEQMPAFPPLTNENSLTVANFAPQIAQKLGWLLVPTNFILLKHQQSQAEFLRSCKKHVSHFSGCSRNLGTMIRLQLQLLRTGI
jgi:hypothetical protein